MLFHQAASSYYSQFKADVLAARPRVQLPSRSSSGSGSNVQAQNGSSSTRASEQLNEEHPDFWLGIHYADSEWLAPAPEDETGPDRVITLDEVRCLAAKFRTRELPGYIPYRATEEMVQKLKGDSWADAAADCLDRVSEQLLEVTELLIKHHFKQFSDAQTFMR